MRDGPLVRPFGRLLSRLALFVALAQLFGCAGTIDQGRTTPAPQATDSVAPLPSPQVTLALLESPPGPTAVPPAATNVTASGISPSSEARCPQDAKTDIASLGLDPQDRVVLALTSSPPEEILNISLLKPSSGEYTPLLPTITVSATGWFLLSPDDERMIFTAQNETEGGNVSLWITDFKNLDTKALGSLERDQIAYWLSGDIVVVSRYSSAAGLSYNPQPLYLIDVHTGDHSSLPSLPDDSRYDTILQTKSGSVYTLYHFGEDPLFPESFFLLEDRTGTSVQVFEFLSKVPGFNLHDGSIEWSSEEAFEVLFEHDTTLEVYEGLTIDHVTEDGSAPPIHRKLAMPSIPGDEFYLINSSGDRVLIAEDTNYLGHPYLLADDFSTLVRYCVGIEGVIGDPDISLDGRFLGYNVRDSPASSSPARASVILNLDSGHYAVLEDTRFYGFARALPDGW